MFMNMRKKIIILLSILTIIISSLNGCIEEEQKEEKKSIIYVSHNQDSDYNKIQEAIDNSKDGNIIYVQNGTYNEIITINKSIQLIGEGTEKTILDFYRKGEIGQITGITITSNNTTIKGFNITKTSGSANVIAIKIKSSNNQILNNTIYRLTEGINLDKKTKNNTIKNNKIINNYYGIQTSDSDNNNITDNNITLSGLYGIYLHLGSDNNIISNNNIIENDYGLRLKGSKYNIITKNEIIKNKKGIYCCCGAHYNTIYNNIFKINIEWNAKENKDLTNYWFEKNLKIGNYWDDYNWTDENEDGLPDLAYVINDEGNIDAFPLMKPEKIIII